MRTFRGYASRASAGILADNPQSADFSRTDPPDGRPSGGPGGLQSLGGLQGPGGEALPPALPPAARRGLAARLGEALFPRLSFRALALALAVNALLVLGFARLVEEDILRLPKPVFWITLEGPAAPAPAAGMAGAAGAGRASGTALRAGAFARKAAGLLAGRMQARQAR